MPASNIYAYNRSWNCARDLEVEPGPLPVARSFREVVRITAAATRRRSRTVVVASRNQKNPSRRGGADFYDHLGATAWTAGGHNPKLSRIEPGARAPGCLRA